MTRALIARAALMYQHATEERDQAIATFMSEQLAAATRFQANSVVPIALYARHRISGAVNWSEQN